MWDYRFQDDTEMRGVLFQLYMLEESMFRNTIYSWY